jgi:hypothetical protein
MLTKKFWGRLIIAAQAAYCLSWEEITPSVIISWVYNGHPYKWAVNFLLKIVIVGVALYRRVTF